MPDNYSTAKAVVRVFSHDAEFDFEVVEPGTQSRLIQRHAQTNNRFTAPSLSRGYRRGGFGWDDWRRENEAEARRLESLLRQDQKYLHIAFDRDAGLVALSRTDTDDIDTSDITIINLKTLTSALETKLSSGRYVEALAWEVGSPTLLIVQRTQRPGLSPFSLLSALAGHPVTYTTFHLANLNISTQQLTEGEAPLLPEKAYHPDAWIYVQRPAKPPQ